MASGTPATRVATFIGQPNTPAYNAGVRVGDHDPQERVVAGGVPVSAAAATRGHEEQGNEQCEE